MRLDDLSRAVIRHAATTNREIVDGTGLRKNLDGHQEGTLTVIGLFLEFSLLLRQAEQTNWRGNDEFTYRLLNNLSLNFGVQANWGEPEEAVFFERMLRFFENTRHLPLLSTLASQPEITIASTIQELYVDAALPKQRTPKLNRQLAKAIDRTMRKRIEQCSYLSGLTMLEQRGSSDLLLSNVRLYARWQMLPRKL